jgi:hypothetical protein
MSCVYCTTMSTNNQEFKQIIDYLTTMGVLFIIFILQRTFCADSVTEPKCKNLYPSSCNILIYLKLICKNSSIYVLSSFFFKSVSFHIVDGQTTL